MFLLFLINEILDENTDIKRSLSTRVSFYKNDVFIELHISNGYIPLDTYIFIEVLHLLID